MRCYLGGCLGPMLNATAACLETFVASLSMRATPEGASAGRSARLPRSCVVYVASDHTKMVEALAPYLRRGWEGAAMPACSLIDYRNFSHARLPAALARQADDYDRRGSSPLWHISVPHRGGWGYVDGPAYTDGTSAPRRSSHPPAWSDPVDFDTLATSRMLVSVAETSVEHFVSTMAYAAGVRVDSAYFVDGKLHEDGIEEAEHEEDHRLLEPMHEEGQLHHLQIIQGVCPLNSVIPEIWGSGLARA